MTEIKVELGTTNDDSTKVFGVVVEDKEYYNMTADELRQAIAFVEGWRVNDIWWEIIRWEGDYYLWGFPENPRPVASADETDEQTS